jgi:hypothetical protein
MSCLESKYQNKGDDKIVYGCSDVIITMPSHRPFFPGTFSLEPSVIPTAHASSSRLQYFLYYVWCSKYSSLLYWAYWIFSGYGFQFFFKPFVLTPEAPIRRVSVENLLLFSFFSASFCMIFLSAGIATFISMRVFSFFVFTFWNWLICRNSSICVYPVIV